MFGFICNIFVAVFIIVNRMVLSPFEIGMLVLFGILIATIELCMNRIAGYIKDVKSGQSSNGSGI